MPLCLNGTNLEILGFPFHSVYSHGILPSILSIAQIMGKAISSYLKTDLEATFMRMKVDYMMNGQLKPAYNVQIAVKNYFIVHGYVSNDRTDYHILLLVLKKHKADFGEILEEVTADSGYCSEKNLLYLKQNKISSYIKLQDHENTAIESRFFWSFTISSGEQ